MRRKSRIAVRHPLAEGESTDENSDSAKEGIEKIKGSHRADAHEEKKGALDT